MRTFFLLGILVIGAAILQAGILTPLLPPWICPELGLLLALASVAFLPPEVALPFVFAMGFQADLQGTMRFGALTFSYLLAAGALLELRRLLARGGIPAVWAATIAGTAVTHGCYLLLGRLLGGQLTFAEGLHETGTRIVSAAIFGGVSAYFMRRWLLWWDLLGPESNVRGGPRRGHSPLLGFGGK